MGFNRDKNRGSTSGCLACGRETDRSIYGLIENRLCAQGEAGGLTHSTAPSPAFQGGVKKFSSGRVNPEPFGCIQGLELVERRAQAFRPRSRRVDF